jgi:hypothetical protein
LECGFERRHVVGVALRGVVGVGFFAVEWVVSGALTQAAAF